MQTKVQEQKYKQEQRYKQRKPQLDSMVYGKVPPQAPDLEEAVLGVLMLEKDKITDVLSLLPSDECFYLDAHQKIYAALLELHNKGAAVDLMTITEHLRQKNELESIGGAHYLTSLTMSVVSSAHVVHHAATIAEKYMLREMIRVSGGIIQAAYDNESPFDLQETFIADVNKLFTERGQTGWQSMKEVARDYLQEKEDRRLGHKGVIIPTTFKGVDDINKGLRPGNLAIIAARPGVGKSAIVKEPILYTAKHIGTVGIVNFEMSATEQYGRMISNESGIPYAAYENEELRDDVIADHVAQLSGLPIFFNKSISMSVNDIIAAATWLKKKHDIKLLVIDYLQLMKSTASGNREQEVSKMSRGLKTLAMALGIPVIALSQLNRDSEKRQDKKPYISDLRESGSLEQDADIVMLLHRDYAAGIEKDANGNSTLHDADLCIAKWRNGKTGNVKLHFDPPTMRFTDKQSSLPF